MSTVATVKHAYTATGANDATKQLSKDRWNASLIVASAAPDGAIFVKDSGQIDGWGLQTILPVANGGTGLASYAVGDLIYASGATTLAKLADVATGSVFVSGGVGVAPAWSASPTLTTVTLGINPATVGEVRLPNNGSGVVARNAANSGNLNVFVNNGSNDLVIGDTNQGYLRFDLAANGAYFNHAACIVAFGSAASASFPALKRDTIFLKLRLSDDSAVSGAVTASLPAAAAARDGIIGFDITLNALIYYVGGNRYKLVGTAF